MTLHNLVHSRAITTETISLAAPEEVEFLREQIYSLRQLVEQLDLELLDKQQQIQDLEQELAQTNRELCNVLAVKETREPQQIERQEKPASKPLGKLVEAIDEHIFLTNQLEIVKTSAKTNTPLSVLDKQASKNSKDAIARTKQFQAQYNEIEFQFASLKSNFIKSGEQITEIVTQLQQPQDEKNTSELLKENHKKFQENLEQLKAHRLRSKELVKDSRKSVKQTQLELAKLQKSNKNLGRVDLCERVHQHTSILI